MYRQRQILLLALAGYGAVALAFSWPLPLHLGTHLTGPPGGDTGVYVWNQWVFRHELLDHQRLPFFTDRIFALTSRANLSFHNYTTFQNLLALPLISILGVVATFNVVYLLMTVLTAYATFLLARHVTGKTPESWLAGVLFAWSPFLVARGTGHFSLVAAAPLPIFLLVLLKSDGQEQFRDAVMLGATVWLAASTDVYYAVYCLLMGMAFVIARTVSIERSPRCGRSIAVRWGLDVLILCLTGFIIAIVMGRGWNLTVMARRLTIHSLYTPMIVLTTLLVARVTWGMRASVRLGRDFWRFARFVLGSGIVAATMLSPVLYAAAMRVGTTGLELPKTYWRSSPSGVDALAFLLPNPNHPLAMHAITEWLTSRDYAESVVSLPFVALITMLIGRRCGWSPSRWWLGLTALFGLLSLGPFIHVAGLNTYVPGPWALLRYVPILGLARTPGRSAVVMMLAFAILFASALTAIGIRYPGRRRAILISAALLLFAELLPVPRPLYSAAIPRFYDRIAAAPDDVRLLELPSGVRDGTSNAGNFTARSQFFQTLHGKALVGGYLSRVGARRVGEFRRDDILNALLILSEGGSLSADLTSRLYEVGPAFIRRSKIGFVVIDRDRSTDALREFARRAFRLEYIDGDGSLDLYRPR
jgi:hypothetical protein